MKLRGLRVAHAEEDLRSRRHPLPLVEFLQVSSSSYVLLITGALDGGDSMSNSSEPLVDNNRAFPPNLPTSPPTIHSNLPPQPHLQYHSLPPISIPSHHRQSLSSVPDPLILDHLSLIYSQNEEQRKNLVDLISRLRQNQPSGSMETLTRSSHHVDILTSMVHFLAHHFTACVEPIAKSRYSTGKRK